jgi:hypothetical protein
MPIFRYLVGMLTSFLAAEATRSKDVPTVR